MEQNNQVIIAKSPFRISLFGGSTDYKNFYEQYGSFIIGTPIDKYCYISMRHRPKILSKQYLCTYSKYELADTIDELKNPLIRETLRYFNMNKPIELFSFSDIPYRTGLGGSSSYCIAMSYLIKKIKEENINKKEIINAAIKIEREILNESGGIQDQIWPFAKGFSSIEINKDGSYNIKPLSITEEFEQELQDSMILIYTEEQRNNSIIAKSHEENINNKLHILEMAKEAYNLFLNEDLENIGKLLYQSWLHKEQISPYISNNKIKNIIDDVINIGAYGAKLLGSGGCGFVLTMCNPLVKQKILEKYKENILDFKINKTGVITIYNQ
jgi:D-glycero-alpha-D-manno-heptose-7-phosphate kinase